MLYEQYKRSSTVGAERRVTIREVNTDKLFVIGETALGDKIRITFSLQYPLVSVPAPGEIWSLTQSGTEWHLGKRQETGTETTRVTNLEPGDRRLEATNKVYINGNDVIVNGVSFNDLVARLEALEGP